MNDARCKRKPDVRQRHLATVLEEEQEVRRGPQLARRLLHPPQLLPAEPQILAAARLQEAHALAVRLLHRRHRGERPARELQDLRPRLGRRHRPKRSSGRLRLGAPATVRILRLPRPLPQEREDLPRVALAESERDLRDAAFAEDGHEVRAEGQVQRRDQEERAADDSPGQRRDPGLLLSGDQGEEEARQAEHAPEREPEHDGQPAPPSIQRHRQHLIEQHAPPRARVALDLVDLHRVGGEVHAPADHHIRHRPEQPPSHQRTALRPNISVFKNRNTIPPRVTAMPIAAASRVPNSPPSSPSLRDWATPRAVAYSEAGPVRMPNGYMNRPTTARWRPSVRQLRKEVCAAWSEPSLRPRSKHAAQSDRPSTPTLHSAHINEPQRSQAAIATLRAWRAQEAAPAACSRPAAGGGRDGTGRKVAAVNSRAHSPQSTWPIARTASGRGVQHRGHPGPWYGPRAALTASR